jgi:hypothetical protein
MVFLLEISPTQLVHHGDLINSTEPTTGVSYATTGTVGENQERR